MKRNLDEFGRLFKRHRYYDGGLELSHSIILGLLATLAGIYGWDKTYPIEKMLKLINEEYNLPSILGDNLLTLKANLVKNEPNGGYNLVYNDDQALIGIKPNHQQFLEAIMECKHELYTMGSDSTGKT